MIQHNVLNRIFLISLIVGKLSYLVVLGPVKLLRLWRRTVHVLRFKSLLDMWKLLVSGWKMLVTNLPTEDYFSRWSRRLMPALSIMYDSAARIPMVTRQNASTNAVSGSNGKVPAETSRGRS
jgi:hypothetical protein